MLGSARKLCFKNCEDVLLDEVPSFLSFLCLVSFLLLAVGGVVVWSGFLLFFPFVWVGLLWLAVGGAVGVVCLLGFRVFVVCGFLLVFLLFVLFFPFSFLVVGLVLLLFLLLVLFVSFSFLVVGFVLFPAPFEPSLLSSPSFFFSLYPFYLLVDLICVVTELQLLV